MTRCGIAPLAILLLGTLVSAQTPADTARIAADTVFVIPAGPVAGTFTEAARVGVLDTIAGWAKIQIEAWVPVKAVLKRMAESAPLPTLQREASTPATSKAGAQQCEARTRKGSRCSRRAAAWSTFCWQHKK